MEDPCICRSATGFLEPAYENEVLFGLIGRLIMGRLISGLCWVCEDYKDEEGCIVMSKYWKSAENTP